MLQIASLLKAFERSATMGQLILTKLNFHWSHNCSLCLLSTVHSAFLLAFLLISTPALGQRQAALDPIADYDFGSWANAGSLSLTNTTCATMIRNNGSLDEYRVRVSDLYTSASGNFYLFLDGNNASTSIEVTVEHMDISEGTYDLLQEGSQVEDDHDSPAVNCPSGDNLYLRVNIASSELAGKPGGDYEGYFALRVKRGNALATENFYVRVTVAASPKVQISHLDSVDFGQHNGLGDLSVTETFCIYSSEGSYNISVDSTGRTGGNHYLLATSGGDEIPLAILFADNGTGPGTVQLNANTASGTGHTSSTDCAGTDNASLTFQLAESDLQAASTGTYSEQITILIVPE